MRPRSLLHFGLYQRIDEGIVSVLGSLGYRLAFVKAAISFSFFGGIAAGGLLSEQSAFVFGRGKVGFVLLFGGRAVELLDEVLDVAIVFHR